MPINSEKSARPATKGEVATVAIQASSAILAVIRSLQAIQSGEKIPDDVIEKLARRASILNELFDELSGWENE